MIFTEAHFMTDGLTFRQRQLEYERKEVVTFQSKERNLGIREAFVASFMEL